ncbi:MAG: hypothetical protein WC205_09325 [Opitutaceae bacterium]|jgi:hypothetical protein
MKLRLPLSLIFAVVLCVIADASQQDIVRLTPDLRATKADIALSEAPVKTGTGKWQATPNLKLHASEKTGGITIETPDSFMGRLPLPISGQVIVAEATLRPTASDGWLALGIGSPQFGSPAWGLGIYVFVNAKGSYTLAGNPDPTDWVSKKTVRLKTGTVPGFATSRKMKLKLEYNRAAETVSLWADGTKVVDGLGLADKGFTIEPAFAGISGHAQTPGEVIVETFSVEIQRTAPLPPSTASQAMQPATIPAWWQFGQTVRFDVVGGKLLPSSTALQAVVNDVTGRTIARDEITRIQAETSGWTWTPPAPGFYTVEFFQVTADGQASVLGSSFALRAPNGAQRSFVHTRQGFAVLPEFKPVTKTVGQFGFTYTLNQKNILLARLIGFDLANIHPIPWGANFTNLNMAIEPEKGVYRWEMLDPHVDALKAANMEIAGQFCYTPLWASPHPEKTNINICVVEATAYAPKDINDYGRFVEATVNRYKDRIHLWELWNEPAVPGGSVFWSDTPENFIKLISTGYETIKRVQPDSEVWLGGLGGRAAYYSFYNRLLQLDATAHFDILSTHGRTAITEFRRLESVHKAPSKPAVVSEWHAILQGNSQSTPVLDEEVLSFRMMRDLFLQLKAGVQRTILFEISNLVEKETLVFAGDNKWFVHSSGLFRVRPQPEPRHAAVVMSNFLNACGRQAAYAKEFVPANDVFGLLLSSGQGPLVTFWSESRVFAISEISSLATTRSTLIDWEGRPVSLIDGGKLAPNRFYYLTSPDEEHIRELEISDRLQPPEAIARLARKTVSATYHDGPLFTSVDSDPNVSNSAWIDRDWSLTELKSSPGENRFSARAAIGAHPEGLDIVVEVNDPVHVQTETVPSWWRADSLQIGIDSEGSGLVGGHTEILAALGTQVPVLWKVAAADTRGDIPALWSPSNGTLKHGSARIIRQGGQTRYQVRIPWAELYPLTYDKSKPIQLSLVVNDSNGSGRARYLEWGSGIAGDKDPSGYGILASDHR